MTESQIVHAFFLGAALGIGVTALCLTWLVVRVTRRARQLIAELEALVMDNQKGLR